MGWTGKGQDGTLQNDSNAFYFDWDTGNKSVNKCQNSSNCTLEFCGIFFTECNYISIKVNK